MEILGMAKSSYLGELHLELWTSMKKIFSKNVQFIIDI